MIDILELHKELGEMKFYDSISHAHESTKKSFRYWMDRAKMLETNEEISSEMRERDIQECMEKANQYAGRMWGIEEALLILGLGLRNFDGEYHYVFAIPQVRPKGMTY